MIAQLRILALALLWSPVVLAFVLFFTFAARGDVASAPPWFVVAAQVVAGLGLAVLLEVVGYRVPATRPGVAPDEAGRASVAAFRQAMILRFALAESVAIVSVAVAFVLSYGGFLTYVTGAAISLALMLLHVWPGERPVRRTEDALEREGARSHLRDALDLPSTSGAIRRL